MAKRTYARRYAEAIFQIALEKNEFDQWQADLDRIAAAMKVATATSFLESTRVAAAEKERVLMALFPGANPLALNLVRLLMARGNLLAMPDIAGQYSRLVDEHRGIEEALVTTAVPIDDREKSRVAADLGKRFGKQIRIVTRVDPSIVGGMIARVNGKLIDGSTRSRLLALKQAIGGAGSGE